MKNPLDALMLQCKRCNHRWLRRTPNPPKQCPECKTTYWAKERVRKIKRHRKAARRG